MTNTASRLIQNMTELFHRGLVRSMVTEEISAQEMGYYLPLIGAAGDHRTGADQVYLAWQLYMLSAHPEDTAAQSRDWYDVLDDEGGNRFLQIRNAIDFAGLLWDRPWGYEEGARLLQRCLEQATVFPSGHDQGSWFNIKLSLDGDGNPTACGSTGCLAGHAVALRGFVPEINADYLLRDGSAMAYRVKSGWGGAALEVDEQAQRLLFVTDAEADFLFDDQRKLNELWDRAIELFPGLIARPDEARIAEITAEGPQVVFQEIAVEDNGVLAFSEIADYVARRRG